MTDTTPVRVVVTEHAASDIERLKTDSERLGLRALALIQLLGDGKISGQPLKDVARYGDLRDCFKVYFGETGTAATHRLVYQETDDGGIEVKEVVAVEQRGDDYVYLLVANRLKRLPAETKRAFNRVHQQVIARRSGAAKPVGKRKR